MLLFPGQERQPALHEVIERGPHVFPLLSTTCPFDLVQGRALGRDPNRRGTLDALGSLVRAGRVRYIGCSNWPAWRIARAVGRSELRGVARFDSVHCKFERDLLPMCLEEGIGVIPYNPIAGGLLSGKHDAAGPPTPGTRFTLGSAAENYQRRYWHQHLFESVDRLRRVAADAGVPLARMAVAWVLNQPAVSGAHRRRDQTRAARRHPVRPGHAVVR
jgi:1-deoxyxylulose-5-phosphate synthase